jgi:hypothetical protein
LALATWIARQGRAIGVSVGFTVIVGAGWPILIEVSRVPGPGRQGLCSLSPIVAFNGFMDILIGRRRPSADHLWWIGFWDVECLALALGLLWLAVRTFDGCFGRIPERPARAPVLSDVVAVLSGVLGVGGLFGAVAIRARGFLGFMPQVDLGFMACILLVAVGFGLLSVLAASSMSRFRAEPSPVLGPAAVLDRRAFAARWWASFRMVLLLAIGPALVALALAWTPIPRQIRARMMPRPGGGTIMIQSNPTGNVYVITTDATGFQTVREATEAEIAAAEAAPPLQTRAASLGVAALAVVTILAHGAAFVSLGAALGVWIRRRGRAIAASVGLVAFVTLCWPTLCILLFLHDPNYHRGLSMASMLPAYTGLLANMYRPDLIAGTISWAGYWDLILALSAVILSGLAICTLDRRLRAALPVDDHTEDDSLQPVGEASGSASIWERVMSK